MLARLRPALEQIFSAYGISELQAQEVLEGSFWILVNLRLRVEHADGWLVRTVIERCQMLREEAILEGPSE